MDDFNVLIVDDDTDFRESLALLVGREGYATLEADTLETARETIAASSPDIALVDLKLPDGSGLELLREEEAPFMPEFVVITGYATVDSAVDATREGALDYLEKPVDRARLRTVLASASRTLALKRERNALENQLRELGRFGKLIGQSRPMQAVYDLIARVSPTDASVLVTGESGTGKELVAETVHALSNRKSRPFLGVNCGAMTASLIESELFGHEKGSFTGADKRRRGYFEEASEGTLFLDEITEMPIELQVKLLRVLETGTITRVGSTSPIDVDVRVIAASNRNPEEAVAEGSLREDLLYRLNVFPIEMPPLRERGDDCELLARSFLDELKARDGVEKRISDGAIRVLSSLEWPGNVRELRNVIERAAILADDEITPAVLPESSAAKGPEPSGDESRLEVRVGASIEDVERRLILATLDHHAGDKKRAAETLGISVKTLYNRLNVYAAEQKGEASE